jgi:hypothetical protein
MPQPHTTTISSSSVCGIFRVLIETYYYILLKNFQSLNNMLLNQKTLSSPASSNQIDNKFSHSNESQNNFC